MRRGEKELFVFLPLATKHWNLLLLLLLATKHWNLFILLPLATKHWNLLLLLPLATELGSSLTFSFFFKRVYSNHLELYF